MITPRDEAQIAFYFRDGYRFERSTAGPMLERAERLGVDSSGQRLPPSCDNWNWREPMRDEESGVYSRYGDDQQRQAHETQLGGGYEPDELLIMKWGDTGRRMQRVERISRVAVRVLEAHYGDRGQGWALRSNGYSGTDTETGKTTYHPPNGPGRIAALYVLTPEGQAFLAKERARSKKNGVSDDLTDDELLATAYALERTQPDAVRRAKLHKVQDAAETMLRSAWAVWMQTAQEKRGRAA